MFTPFGDRFTIDVPGPDDLEMEGDLFDHEFTIGRSGQTVAAVSKRWFSMRDTYAVDVAADQDDLLILASVLALDLAEDQSASNTEPKPAAGRGRAEPATDPHPWQLRPMAARAGRAGVRAVRRDLRGGTVAGHRRRAEALATTPATAGG